MPEERILKVYSEGNFRNYVARIIWINAHDKSRQFYRQDNEKIELSYIDDNNTHILEAAMQAFWKRGGYKLSSLLTQG